MEIQSISIFKPRLGVKNYITRYKDDSISIKSLFLFDTKEMSKDVTLLCTKFGKCLGVRNSGRMSKETIS